MYENMYEKCIYVQQFISQMMQTWDWLCYAYVLKLNLQVFWRPLFFQIEVLDKRFFCFSEKSEKRFQKKVKSLINVIKFSTFTSTFASSKVGPENNDEDDNIEEDIDVLISSHLELFM